LLAKWKPDLVDDYAGREDDINKKIEMALYQAKAMLDKTSKKGFNDKMRDAINDKITINDFL